MTLEPQGTLANVELQIEELVLYGFAAGDRYRIGAAVERELTRLFAERGVPSSLLASIEIASLDGGAFQVAPDAKADAIGAQVAHSVYGGVAHER